jgi:arylsulfatase A-like enzyme
MSTNSGPRAYRDALGDDRPKSATPNVVVVLLDDVGFAQFGCFGAEIETPAIDKLAANGLRYNRFHVTSICSSSRAALMTGRNHHAVGMGSVADSSSSAPGYTSRLPKTAATMQRVLRDAGYNTYAIGKWHLTPTGERSHAGPFTQWPLGTGFERYYGFLRADANQWTPNLVCDNHAIDPPATPDEGYHVSEDLADLAIAILLDQKQVAPDKPFFMYFATGAMHAPHQVAQPWIDHYKGRFDDGWEAMRQRVFERQVAEGIVPADTELSDRPSWIPDWSELNEDDRALFARMHEVYAGFMSHTDAQIGRLADFLAEIGELDNTIFIVTSDNGASAEGGEVGAVNEHNFTMRIAEDHAANLEAYDTWGGERGYYHYAWGWAWAGNTPLRLWKRYAWLGGTRTPMVVHWPDGIGDAGAIRSQFCHIVDLMPTILDCCDVNAPQMVDGVEQQPMAGASIAATFMDAGAPNARDRQYFEMMGSRGMFSGEWKATTDHVSPLLLDEQRLLGGSRSYEDDQWHLFHLPSDFAEAVDVADANPDVLERIKAEWLDEAQQNNVFPLFGGYDPLRSDPVSQSRASASLADPNKHLRRVFRPGGSPITDEALPKFSAGGTCSVAVELGDDPGGVLVALGDWTQGWALYMDDGRLNCCINIAGVETLVAGPDPVPSNANDLGFRLSVRSDEGVDIELLVDGATVAIGHTAHPMPVGMLQVGGTGLCIGYDRGFPVTDRYQPPSPFSGAIHHVTIEVPGDTPEDPSARLAQALHED